MNRIELRVTGAEWIDVANPRGLVLVPLREVFTGVTP